MFNSASPGISQTEWVVGPFFYLVTFCRTSFQWNTFKEIFLNSSGIPVKKLLPSCHRQEDRGPSQTAGVGCPPRWQVALQISEPCSSESKSGPLSAMPGPPALRLIKPSWGTISHIHMPETQESQGCSFCLKVCVLMTQGEAIFQVKSKDRKKKPMFRCEGSLFFREEWEAFCSF